mgnify:CR=1 FL=1
MNCSVLSGNVATDPKFTSFTRKKKGKPRKKGLAANFRISVKRGYEGKDGVRYDYFSCAAYDHSAKYIKNYIDEGDLVLVHGALRNNNYEDEDGETIYRDEINVTRIELLRKNEYDEDDEDEYEDEDEYGDDEYEDEEEDEYDDDEDYDEEEDEYDDEDERPRRKRKTARRRKAVSSKAKSVRTKKRINDKPRSPARKKTRQERAESSNLRRKRTSEKGKSNEIDQEFEEIDEEEFNDYGFN